MMRRYRTVAILFWALFLMQGNFAYAQITVVQDQTAQALAQKLAGQGVTISNATLNCAPQANGFFNVTSSNIGIDSGIVLTTGRVLTYGGAYGLNGLSAYLASNDNGYPGDGMLTPLAGQTTLDACALEFDVVPNGDSLNFNYVFSSEEYMNAVCGPYNDAFAFFISGPGITGTENMALVPGTSIPVTINSINNGIPGSTGHLINCTSIGAGSPFTSYYIDNSASTTFTHKGLTTVLQAVHAVTPCKTYHLKIVIADAGDPLYDSGVFLKAGSLSVGDFNISALNPFPYDAAAFCVKGCLPGRFRIKRSVSGPEAKTVKFIVTGDAVSGIDYSPIPDSVVIPANQAYADLIINGIATPMHGTKTIQLFILSPYSCTGTNNIVDSASLAIYDTLHISISTPDTVICGNTSVLLDVTGDSILTYHWEPTAGLSNANTPNPSATPAVNTTYTVTASLTGSSCPVKTAQISFTVKLTPEIILSPDTTICANDDFMFRAATTQSNLYYSYSWIGPGGYTSSLLSPVLPNVAAINSGDYTFSVLIDTNGCKATSNEQLWVTAPDTPSLASARIYCLNKMADSLKANGTGLLWYRSLSDSGSNFAPVPITDEVGDYIYYVTQTIGNCESDKLPIGISVKKCCDGNIFIPTAFTPNNDGLNDRFEALMDYGYRINSMYIFNRWGQIVYSGLTGTWDGKFGGVAAETGTYFYKIQFGCILGGTTERVGDITLIR